MTGHPYKKIYFNEITGKLEKWISCYPRLEKGQVNACAAQCPGTLRFVGLPDDPDSPVHNLVLRYKIALFPEKGTQPKVFYVSPSTHPRAETMVRLGSDVKDEVTRLEAELQRS